MVVDRRVQASAAPEHLQHLEQLLVTGRPYLLSQALFVFLNQGVGADEQRLALCCQM